MTASEVSQRDGHSTNLIVRYLHCGRAANPAVRKAECFRDNPFTTWVSA